MKILFVANAIVGENPGLGGGEVRFIEIAKSWADKGHEIHLMSAKGERGSDLVLDCGCGEGFYVMVMTQLFLMPKSLVLTMTPLFWRKPKNG